MKSSFAHWIRMFLVTFFVGIGMTFLIHSVFAQEQTAVPTVYCLSPNCPVTPSITFEQISPTSFQENTNVSNTTQGGAPIQLKPKKKHHHKNNPTPTPELTSGEENILQQLITEILQLIASLTGQTTTNVTAGAGSTTTTTVAPTSAAVVVPTSSLAATPIPTATPVPIIPTQVVTAPANIPVAKSINWSGYSFTTPIKTGDVISATWNTSTVTCSTQGDGLLSPWIGFGGFLQTDQDIAQLGNDLDCSNLVQKGAAYNPWEEAFPADAVYINEKVNPGDQITASVTSQGNGAFATTISDTTAGWTVNTPMKFATNYVAQSGEAILEDVLGGNGNPIGGAPQFTPAVAFNNFVYTSGGTATPLAGAPTLTENEIEDGNNTSTIPFTLSTVTGGNFTETWQNF